MEEDGVKADRINIVVGGGGTARLTNVEAGEIVTRIAGGGTVTVSGKAGNQVATVAGGGRLLARELVTNQTEVRVNGGGVAEVNATEKLSASANAGARVSYVPTDASISKSINKYATFGPLSETTDMLDHVSQK